MNLKTFQADSLREALGKVREELGPEAVIVRTRQTARKAVGGRKTCYEVTAATGIPGEPANRVEPAWPGRASPSAVVQPGSYDWIGRLPRVHQESKAPVDGALRFSGGIRFRSGKPVKILVLGPSGSGKTSLIRKLAAEARIKSGKRVGIVAADRRRLGAQQEIALFSRTLGAQCIGIYDAGEIPAALFSLRSCDLVLCDAPAPAGAEDWDYLLTLRNALLPDETHLVLNACQRSRELLRTVETFYRIRPNRLSFTRLDECLEYECLMATARSFPGTLGYFVQGPSATGEIAAASAGFLRAEFPSALESGEVAFANRNLIPT